MKILLLAALTLALAGCVEVPVTDATAEVVQADVATSGDAVIVITRGTIGFIGSVHNARVYIDDQPVASLRPSQQIRVPVSAGEHVVGVTTWPSSSPTSALATTIKSGDTKHFRVMWGPIGGPVILPGVGK
jgi:hypothetical protein